jgi:hypothetical protein
LIFSPLDDVGTEWCLFNDFLVEPCTIIDALTYKKWKVPAVLQYIRMDQDQVLKWNALPSPIPIPTIFNNVYLK